MLKIKLTIITLIFALKSFGNISSVPDSIINNLKVKIDVNYDTNKINEIAFLNDKKEICKQKFIKGKLSSIKVFNSEGKPVEIIYLYNNGRINETVDYKSGLMTKRVIYRKNGKISIIYYYENDILIRYTKCGRDGQPLKL